MSDGLQQSPLEIDLVTAQRILDRADGTLRAESAERLGEGIKSDVWLIDASDGGRYIAKAFKSEYAWCVACEDAFFAAFEAGAPTGIDGVPRRLASIDDREVFDRPVTVHHYAPGKPMLRANGFSDEDQFDSYRALGRVLRRLHEIDQPNFATLPIDPETDEPRSNRDYMTGRWANSWNHFVASGGSRYLASRIRSYLLDREELWDRCTAPKLCHGDPHPANVIVERGDDGVVRFSALIDWEVAIAGDPIFDLANSIFNSVGDREAKLRALTEGYGDLPSDWRDRYDAYVVYFALANWTFVSRYGARAPLRKLDRELAELTGSSRSRMFRSAVRRRLSSG